VVPIKRARCEEISNRDTNSTSGPVCPPGEVALLAVLRADFHDGLPCPQVVNSVTAGGRISYQSKAQTFSCSQGISDRGTALKFGGGPPVSVSTTMEVSTGSPFERHQFLTSASAPVRLVPTLVWPLG
jgi:hypothetical protein